MSNQNNGVTGGNSSGSQSSRPTHKTPSNSTSLNKAPDPTKRPLTNDHALKSSQSK